MNATPNYSLDWREGAKRRRKSLGKDAAGPQLAFERHVAALRARATGIEIPEESAPALLIEEACKEFLDETRLQLAPKTLKQYETAMAYFQESCKKRRLDEVDRRKLLDFRRYLGEEKKLSQRTIWAKMMVVGQMLKAYGRGRLLRRGDWPRYVERVPQAYGPEELKRFFAACAPEDFLLFQFFLGSGFRDKEVQYLTWQNLSLEEQLVRVTAKPSAGFYPKTWEEREVLLPHASGGEPQGFEIFSQPGIAPGFFPARPAAWVFTSSSA